jgi:hypothetical protein
MPKRKMSKLDLKVWQSKNERLNKDKEVKLGMRVQQDDGWIGVVVKIVPSTEDFHGTIYVWQEERMEYGADNCEHFCHNNWKTHLRILE